MTEISADDGPRFAILDDMFRCVENGTGPHPDNLLWLDAVLSPAIRRLGGSQIRISSHDFAQRKLYVLQVMADCGLAPGVAAWAQLLQMDDTSVIGPWLRTALSDIDIVVGFELPNVVFDALAATDLIVIDLSFSPIRFLSDLCLDVRCNDAAFARHLGAIVIPEDEVIGGVAQITGTVRRRFNGVRSAEALGSAGILLGQTEIDASLANNGRIARLGDFTDRILAWAGQFDTVILKPHPYGPKAMDLPALRRAGPRLVSTSTSPYQLFSYENVVGAAAISSGSLTEAGWFGVASEQFLTPLRARHPVRPVERVSSAFFSSAFWQAWHEGREPLADARRLPSLRAQIDADWGYDTSYPNPKFKRVRRLSAF